jgi:hypothetical protein
LQSGDTLLIRGGTYNEIIKNYVFGGIRGGTSDANRTTIMGYPGETAIVTDGLELAPTNAGCPANLCDAPFVTFKNIVISNGGIYWHQDSTTVDGVDMGNTFGVAIGWGANNGILRNSSIHDMVYANFGLDGYGIYMGGSSANNLIEHCQFYNIDSFGLHMWSDMTEANNIVRYNSFINTGRIPTSSAGVIISHGAGHQVYSNIFADNRTGIIMHGTCSNCLAYNNTIVRSLQMGIDVDKSSTQPIIKNNIVAQSGLANICERDSTGANCNGGGPISPVYATNLCDSSSSSTGCTSVGSANFVNASGNDFHLTTGSTLARDQGSTLGAPWNLDIDGVSRPQGSAYDLGAYEFSAVAGGTAPTLLRVIR